MDSRKDELNHSLGLPKPTQDEPASLSETSSASAGFRTVPKDAEAFGKIPQVAERKETHTLTVRETARLFEDACVARTERSIINWCQRNRQGISRLDCYYDPNERKYYITPQSVEAVIQEEIHRAKKTNEQTNSEHFGSPVAHVKHFNNQNGTNIEPRTEELQREILDLKIANRGKDHFIELMKNERSEFIEKIQILSRMMGRLEINSGLKSYKNKLRTGS